MEMSSVNPEMMSAILSSFREMARAAGGLVGLVLTAKLALGLVSFSSPEEMMGHVKDAFLFFACLILFPELFRISVEVVGGLNGSLSTASANIQVAESEMIFSKVLSFMEEFSIFNFLVSLFPLSVTYLAESLSSLLLMMMVSVYPVLLLISFLLGGGGSMGGTSAMRTYYLGLLSILMWPVMWNLFEVMGQKIRGDFEGSEIKGIIFFMVLALLKLASPVISIFLLQSVSMSQGARMLGTASQRLTGSFLSSRSSNFERSA